MFHKAAATVFAGIVLLAANLNAQVVTITASAQGQATIDGINGKDGNPFATAFCEGIILPDLTVDKLWTCLQTRTSQESESLQKPDLFFAPENQRQKPLKASLARAFIFFAFSNYDAWGLSLPGVKYDQQRLEAAARTAGYEVISLLDPTRQEWQSWLETLAVLTGKYDEVILYATGHRVENRNGIYLIPPDFPMDDGNRGYFGKAIPLFGITKNLQARTSSIFLYGACRNNPF